MEDSEEVTIEVETEVVIVGASRRKVGEETIEIEDQLLCTERLARIADKAVKFHFDPMVTSQFSVTTVLEESEKVVTEVDEKTSGIEDHDENSMIDQHITIQSLLIQVISKSN